MSKEKIKNFVKHPLLWGTLGFIVVLAGFLYFDLGKNGVAMRVNDNTFSYKEINEIANQISQEFEIYGMSASKEEIKEETVERIIGQSLITQYAKERGIEVSQEEIDGQFREVMAMYGIENEEDFLAQLEMQGMENKEEIEELLSFEIKVNKLINLYGEEVDVSDEDVRDYYDDYVLQMESMMNQEGMEDTEQEILSFEEMELDLRTQLAGEKATPLILNKIEELREEAIIEIYFSVDDLDIKKLEFEIDPNQFEFE